MLGVTGSGKTFTMANVIANVNFRPTLVLAHNKTLAAQLCSEFREFFPNNAVEYFVSYYDYYQPGVRPGKDVISKRTRPSTPRSISCAIRRRARFRAAGRHHHRLGLLHLFARRPGGIPRAGAFAAPGDELPARAAHQASGRNAVQPQRHRLRPQQFPRARRRGGDFPLQRGQRRGARRAVRGRIERISRINTVTGEVDARLLYAPVYPASHYVTSEQKRDKALRDIEDELAERIAFFEKSGKLIEAQRIRERVLFDIEQIREIGFCNGVENYSRVLAGREPGSEPYTLLDYFPPDFLMFIDESHVTVPQVRG